MIIHGKFKLVADIEKILKYLKNTFVSIKEELFDTIEDPEQYEKLVKFHQTTLRPCVDKLIKLALDEKSSEDAKKKELEKFKKLLKNLNLNLKDKNAKLKEQGGENDQCFFSGSSENMSLVDIIIHSDVITIVGMYSAKRELSDTEFKELSSWLTIMEENSNAIKLSIDEMNKVIVDKRLYSNHLDKE